MASYKAIELKILQFMFLGRNSKIETRDLFRPSKSPSKLFFQPSVRFRWNILEPLVAKGTQQQFIDLLVFLFDSLITLVLQFAKWMFQMDNRYSRPIPTLKIALESLFFCKFGSIFRNRWSQSGHNNNRSFFLI